MPEDAIRRRVQEVVAEAMDLTPRGIRKHLDLNKPIYARTSAYGHFGRAPDKDGGFSWERLDLVEAAPQAEGVAPALVEAHGPALLDVAAD